MTSVFKMSQTGLKSLKTKFCLQTHVQHGEIIISKKYIFSSIKKLSNYCYIQPDLPKNASSGQNCMDVWNSPFAKLGNILFKINIKDNN